ncbi:Sm ribonucleo [Sulfolobales archaeon HS-7]|nr:Sm ribonucleo [Sulfolobales archaeon HS-7]
MSSQNRRIVNDIASMLDKQVVVRLISGKEYIGQLTGYDLPSLTLSLTNAKDNNNNSYYKVVINGNSISEILMKTTPLFVPSEFAELVEKTLKLRPGDVKVYEETGVVTIMEKITVTENIGVEGTGPLAQKVTDIYNEYIKKKKEQKQ